MEEAVPGSLTGQMLKILILKGRKSQENANLIIFKRIHCIAQEILTEGRCFYYKRKTNENTYWKKGACLPSILIASLRGPCCHMVRRALASSYLFCYHRSFKTYPTGLPLRSLKLRLFLIVNFWYFEKLVICNIMNSS